METGIFSLLSKPCVKLYNDTDFMVIETLRLSIHCKLEKATGTIRAPFSFV